MKWPLQPWRLMLFLLCTSPLESSLFAEGKANTLTPQEVSEGWILLWDGETHFGWESHGQTEWKMADGVISAESGDNGWLGTTSQFADFVLKVEYRTGENGNSGIFLRSAKEGEPAKTGYELQICDTHKDYPTGSLVNYVRAKKIETQADQWHNYEILAEGDHFVVRLDGKRILDARDKSYGVGHVGLQYNKDKKIEFRNIRLKPLGLKPIFNGKDLGGWQKVDNPEKLAPHQWSVKESSIHVEKGPGQLETDGNYQDFVLQLEIRTNPQNEKHHPNSGVFFRGDKGKFWTGYESQIRNEYKDGDRSQAVDFGTGGIYHYQPARRVVPNDGEFFAKTVVAQARHMAVWINGIQVSDYTDERAEGTDARKEARLKAGTISLQAHDPTTNLDFRNLRIVELPRR